MDDIQIEKIIEIVSSYPQIKLVYLFGSQATGDVGPLSDYDFAIYLDESDNIKLRDIQFELAAKIAKILQTDKIDLVVLNLTDNPSLKYHIVKERKLFFEREPFRVLIEPRILNEYFDFQFELQKHGLTRSPH